MSILTDLTDIKTKANGLRNNKVTNLAYDSTAYSENIVASPESYDWSQHNNIPQQTASAMKMTETFIDKGWRLRFPILNKYFFNAFFGRASYNLNKLTDFFYSLLDALISALGVANGFATLDSNGRIPASQATETLMAYKGAWSASTNTPVLSDGMAGAVKGDMYLCSDSGTVTFGTGNTWSFLPNDRVVYDGTKWKKWSAGNVRRVCNITPDGLGEVDLTAVSDVTDILNNEVISVAYSGILGSYWKAGTGGESYTFRGATYGNGIWVACSVNQGLWWSEDGKTWTKSTTSGIASYGFRCAHYLNGIWVAGSDDHGVWWSEDGKVWVQGTGLTSTAIVYHINSDDSIFVAGSSVGIWWSTDGKAWTLGTGVGTGYYTSVIRKLRNLWLACTQNGMWWSTNGKDWVQGTGNITTYAMENVSYGGGYFVAIGTSCGIWYSTDGKAWTLTSTSAIQSYTFYAICYMNGLFVAGSSGYGLWYSIDGKTWKQITSVSTSLTFTNIKYANGIWVACSTTGGVYTSDSGFIWVKVSGVNTILNSPFINIGFADGMFTLGTSAGMYYSDWLLFI